MRSEASIGLSNEEIINFFRQPIAQFFLSPLEGNRIFAAGITSITGEKIIISSEMVDFEDDEIGVLSINFDDNDTFWQNAVGIPADCRNIASVYKIVGEIDAKSECECGIALETPHGIVLVFTGSFPHSINVVCPWFNQNLTMLSFQRLKYEFRLLSNF